MDKERRSFWDDHGWYDEFGPLSYEFKGESNKRLYFTEVHTYLSSRIRPVLSLTYQSISPARSMIL